MEDIISKKERFSKMFWSSRNQVGKSQEYMAMGLGVSKKTIQNWEKGTSSPDFFQAILWFELLGLNPMKWYMEFLFPSNDDDINLSTLIDSLPSCYKKQLYFVFAGNHGSSPISLIQMLVAHCHTPMYDRYNVARTVESNYQIALEPDSMICKGECSPDMDMLHNAILKGRDAIVNRKDGYVNI